jgi:16S rRNA (adenine1518-N6/adenine1519-N6)-dimethyltransferase
MKFKNKEIASSAIRRRGGAKKSLGQNFLKSEPALRKIIEAGEIKPDDVVLEIGPGKGALTKKLLEHAGLVVAVEKDRELFEFLKIKFEKEIFAGKLILLNEDILEFDINKVISKNPGKQKFSNGLAGVGDPENRGPEKIFAPGVFKLIANIPYNITGAILKKFLTAENQPKLMVLMVQNEVAKRIVARDGKESILSISVKAYGEPKMIMKVPARYFSPAPKVDSAVIAIKNISRKLFIEAPKTVQSSTLNKVSMEKFEKKFWEIVKTGFAHKRKKLSSNLKNLVKNKNLASVSSLGNKRAEDLPLKDWIVLTMDAIISS